MKYLEDGSAVNVVKELSDGFVVRRVLLMESYHDEPDEMISSSEEYANKVYDNPPAQAYHQAIADIREAIASYEKELAEKQNKLNALTDDVNDHERLLRQIKALPELKNIETFIDSGFTHVVSTETYSDIPTKQSCEDYEMLCQNDRRRQLKLISFSGAKDKGWQLHQYSDGSGSSKPCIPCANEDEADMAMKGELEKVISQEVSEYNLPKLVTLCAQYGVTVPGPVKAKAAAYVLAQKNNELEKLEKRRRELDDEINKAKS